MTELIVFWSFVLVIAWLLATLPGLEAIFSLGAGVDPYALSTVTRDMLLVLRTGTTNRAFAEAKLQLMSRLPVRILGAVLNGTPQTQTYRYYSYLPGYHVEDEEVALQAGD